MASTPEQQHQHDQTGDLDYYRDRTHHLESRLTALRAVLASGEPDWRRRCEDAAAALRGLLAIPDVREGAWEAGPVRKLDEPLRDVLAVLDGEAGAQ